MGADMVIVLVLIAALMLLMGLGLDVYAALGFVGFLGYMLVVGGSQSLAVSGSSLFRAGAEFTYIAIPLFVFMGLVFSQGGVVTDLFTAAELWLRRIPGGLGIATVVSCGLFAAASGSSVAVVAGMSKIAVPEMVRAGYPRKLAAGVVAAGGTIGMMIPPSIVMVIYALLTGTSIGRLFMAGVVPGILSVTIYSVLIYTLIKRGYGTRDKRKKGNPEPKSATKNLYGEDAAESTPSATLTFESAPLGKRLRALPAVLPAIALFLVVMGSIYAGLATPTEAAALGAAGALLVLVALRSFKVGPLLEAARDTVDTTSSVLILFIMAVVFGDFLVVSGLTPRLASLVAGLPLPPTGVVIAVLMMYLLLGFFLESGSILILTMPIIYPILNAVGIDGIWFGVLVVKVIENAIITPPMGISVYVVNAALPEIPLEEVFRGIMPFVVADWVTLSLLIAFPSLVLWLPNAMS